MGACERLLRDVLRRARVAAEQTPRHPDRAIAVAVHERIEAPLEVRVRFHHRSCRCGNRWEGPGQRLHGALPVAREG